MPRMPKTDPVKHCETCGTLLTRKRYGKRLEDFAVFVRRHHCNLSCANTRAVVTKDAHHWRARKFKQATCQECGGADRLHVHHLDRNPANNDPANLTTLCASCHLKLHWREDREFRLGQMQRRPSQACVMCGTLFHPRWAKKQTCSPVCKAALLSVRTTDVMARTGVSTRQRSADGKFV